MIFSFNTTAICILATAVLLNVSPCTCRKNACSKNPRTLTPGINFKLKDRATGNDILPATTVIQPVPDSIRLKDARTGVFYALFYGQSMNEVGIYSQQYARPVNVTDSLVFYFGNAVPDTLIVYTGSVDGWRGDECGTVKDAGITKVVLRGQVLVESTDDISVFTLRK
jgi:hypothetical protein